MLVKFIRTALHVLNITLKKSLSTVANVWLFCLYEVFPSDAPKPGVFSSQGEKMFGLGAELEQTCYRKERKCLLCLLERTWKTEFGTWKIETILFRLRLGDQRFERKFSWFCFYFFFFSRAWQTLCTDLPPSVTIFSSRKVYRVCPFLSRIS